MFLLEFPCLPSQASRGHVRSIIQTLILSLLVFALNGTALVSQQIQTSKPAPEIVVVECVAERLGMLPKDVRLDLSVAKQPKPGDDLDFIEILSCIEETLNIEINDEMLADIAGVSAGSDLTNVLTIKQLQQVVKNSVTK